MTSSRPVAPTSAPAVSLFSLVAILGSTLVFALLDTTAKYAGYYVPILEVVWLRFLVNFVLAAIVYNPISQPRAWTMRHPVLQMARAGLLATVTVSNFLALHYLQLAENTTISFLTPLVITLLSVVLLGESIDRRRLIAILGGFVGVVLVTRPGFGGFHPAMLLALLSTLAGAGYNMLTRYLAVRESPGSMVLMLAGGPTLVLAPVLPFVWVTPDRPLLWGALLFIGAAGGYGHYLVLVAHRRSTAAALAPYTYASLIWMVVTGFLVFGDVPSGWTIAGALTVVVSGLYLLHQEQLGRDISAN